MITFLFYVVLPLVAMYWVAHFFIPKIKLRTIAFFVVMTSVLYILSFGGGLAATAISTMFSPDYGAQYWHSMDMSTSLLDAHQPDSLISYFSYPWFVGVQAVILSLRILFTHYTWEFAFFHAVAAIIMLGWISATLSAWRMRNPAKCWNFSST